MSTFLQDGEILVKIGHRFLHFNSEKGDFIGQIKFNDELLDRYQKNERMNLQNSQIVNLFVDSNKGLQKSKNMVLKKKPREQILDFLGRPYPI